MLFFLVEQNGKNHKSLIAGVSLVLKNASGQSSSTQILGFLERIIIIYYY